MHPPAEMVNGLKGLVRRSDRAIRASADRLVHRFAPWGVRVALGQTMGIRVSEVAPVRRGASELFRVDSSAGPLGVRLLGPGERYEHAREVGQLLARLGVPHPELLYAGEPRALFGRAMVVHEWIRGVPAIEALRDGVISEQELFTEVGRMLRRVQDDGVSAFVDAFWQSPSPARDFAGLAGTHDYSSCVRLLRAQGEHDAASLVERAIDAADSLLDRLKVPTGAVLVHGYLDAGNLMLRDGQVVLIDSWNAHGGAWLSDVVRTHWLQSPAAATAMLCGLSGTDVPEEPDPELAAYHTIVFQVGLVEFFVRAGQPEHQRKILEALARELTRCSSSKGADDTGPT